MLGYVNSVAKCNEFHNLYVVFCEVTGGLGSPKQFTVNTLILYDISLVEGADPSKAPGEGSRELAERPLSLLVFGSKSTD